MKGKGPHPHHAKMKKNEKNLKKMKILTAKFRRLRNVLKLKNKHKYLNT